MISMKCLDGSVHLHYLFYFVKLSHNLIKLHPVARIIHRCHTNWSFTMECETEKFLVYVISDVGRINIILIIFIWYFRMSTIWVSMNNKLLMWYINIPNGVNGHIFLYAEWLAFSWILLSSGTTSSLYWECLVYLFLTWLIQGRP